MADATFGDIAAARIANAMEERTGQSTFGRAFTPARPTYTDRLIYEQQHIPGPGSYTLPDIYTGVRGGTISNAEPPSRLDEAIQRAAQVPGPGHYNDGIDTRIEISSRGIIGGYAGANGRSFSCRPHLATPTGEAVSATDENGFYLPKPWER